MCKKIIRKFNFNGVALYKTAPFLISSSPFDKYLPKEEVKPYPHQIDSPKLLEKLNDGFVNIYNTATNSGKTFTTVGIAHRVKELKKYMPELRFIFCCEVQSVRKKVEQLLLYSDISVTTFLNRTPDSVALTCNPEEAVILLSKKSAGENYVLFIDEITIGAGDIKSTVLKNYMQVFSLAPKWTYISNANLPTDDRTLFLINFHRRMYPTSRLEITTSNVIFNCSNVETFSKHPILPHMGCKSVSQLKEKLMSIKDNQFKGKMYNPSAVRNMYDSIVNFLKWTLSDDVHNITDEEMEDIDSWIKKLPNIDMLFGDVSQLYSDNIRKIAVQILEVVVEFGDDYMVQKICQVSPSTCSFDTFLEHLKLYEYQNVTLIAHPNPIEFATIMFKDVLVSIKDKIGSLYKLQQTYAKTTEAWEKEYERLQRNPDEIDRVIQQTEMSALKPKLNFPDCCQINTFAYLKKYSAKSLKTDARFPLEIELINTQNMSSEDLILLLYAGVGVYSEKTDSSYREVVLDLISEGKLDFIVSDVCYGMDYPIGCLFVTPDFSSAHSLNTIYQLMSRVGRGRMSYMGHIFIDDECASRILNPIDETSTIELKNMEKILTSSSVDGIEEDNK